MTDPREVRTQLTFRISLREKLIPDRASRVTGKNLSEFIRLAVIPAAENAVVADAIKAPRDDAA